MTRYLLDTDILSNLVRRQPAPSLKARLSREPTNNLLTSVVSVYELRAGCTRRPSGGEELWQRIRQEVLSRVQILSLDYEHALRAGDLLARLREAGKPIGVEDTLIGAIALVENASVVTGNTRHFSRIPGLRLENWLLP